MVECRDWVKWQERWNLAWLTRELNFPARKVPNCNFPARKVPNYNFTARKVQFRQDFAKSYFQRSKMTKFSYSVPKNTPKTGPEVDFFDNFGKILKIRIFRGQEWVSVQKTENLKIWLCTKHEKHAFF